MITDVQAKTAGVFGRAPDLGGARDLGDAPTTRRTLTVRLFAGARAAAGGVREVDVDVDDGALVGAALTALSRAHPGIDAVIPACSFLLDGVRATAQSHVGDAATLDVLPPFSGG